MAKKPVAYIRDKLLAPKKLHQPPDYTHGLSSGSTLLNLASTGTPHAAYLPGGYYHLVGDPASGKTWLVLSLLAEASINSLYDQHRFIFDDGESGVQMDIRRHFGSKLLSRLEPPAGSKTEPIYSSTLDDFYFNVDNAFADGRPFLYVLDSMDSITTVEEEDKFQKRKRAAAKGREETGSYGTSKAKQNSSDIRLIHNKLRRSPSMVFILSQTRDNIGYGAQFTPKTSGGGKSLTFYAQLEMWTSIKEHLKTKYKDVPVEQGILSKIRVNRSRFTGRDRTVQVPIYHSSGIDDVGSCVDYLVYWKVWPQTAGLITPEGLTEVLGAKGQRREDLIRTIETANAEHAVRNLVWETWTEVEAAVAVQRKPRYGEPNSATPEGTDGEQG